MAEHASNKPIPDKPVEQAKQGAEQAAKQEVTARPTRDYRTYLFQIGLIAVIGAFVTLTILVKTTPSFPIDLQITRALQSISWPPFDWFMRFISWPGFPPQSFIIPLLIVGVFYWFGFHWEAVASIFASLFTPVVNVIIKDYVRRPRPGIDLVHVLGVLNSFSFPSGHVMFYVGVFGFVWFLIYTLLKRSWRRTTMLWILGIFIVLIGPSRVYMGQHWPSDALGAYLLGFLTLLVNIWVYRWGKKRFFVRQPAAPEKPKTAT